MPLTAGVLHHGAAVATPPAADLLPFIDGLPLHEVRLIGGCGFAAFAERLATGTAVTRPIFRFDLVGSTMPSMRESAIAQLARIVSELWPSAWGGEDFTELREDALSLAQLPIRLASLAERVPDLSQAWARRVVRSLLRCRGARVPASPDLEWQQLALMLAPAGSTVAISLHPDKQATAFIAAVEWLAARASVAIVVLADAVPPAIAPWTRLLYGARIIAPPTPEPATPEPPVRQTPAILAAPAVEGRPHPLSAAEMRLHRAIQADAELQSLFGFNLFVDDASLLHAKVDLLWRTGRVAVEVDGADHRAAAKYRADRDRDHRLMCAGYRVLRLTNEEVVEDCGRAVEKIREVMRLAQRERA